MIVQAVQDVDGVPTAVVFIHYLKRRDWEEISFYLKPFCRLNSAFPWVIEEKLGKYSSDKVSFGFSTRKIEVHKAAGMQNGP